MTSAPTRSNVEQLLGETAFPLISLYMPTHRAGTEIWQDPIRFRNLLRSAEHNLEAAVVPRQEIDALLEPLLALRADREFWQNQEEGLALFHSSRTTEVFRLPTTVPQLAVVGSRFHLKPLLMALADEQRFFVVALSQHAVRLFRGSRYGLDEIRGLNLPAGVKQERSERTLRSHSTGPRTAMHHGPELDWKAQIAAYCHRIDVLLNSVTGPNDLVILASVDYVAAIYRELSSARNLAAATISGSPDFASSDELFEKALPIALSHFDDQRLQAEERFLRCLRGGHAVETPSEMIRAAREGRVETLFVPVGIQMWGEVMKDGEVCLSDCQRPQDQDLWNAALVDTWKSGGRVLAMAPEKMPGGRLVAAITRF